MNFSESFVRRPVMTVVLTVSAILFGVLAYLNLPVNDLPAVDYPVIQVNVGYPGATPETMANNVATPLERQFMQIPGPGAGDLEQRRRGTRASFCNSIFPRASTPPRRMCKRRSARPRGNCRWICRPRRRSRRPIPTISRLSTSVLPATR